MITTIEKKPFYFVRHGETDWNRQRIFQGISDVPLNETGIEQAQLVGRILKNESIAHIVSSPLIRAKRTAEIINEHLQKPITIVDELKELSFGAIEGKPIGDGAVFEEWLKGLAPSGAERAEEFDARVMRGLLHGQQFSSPTLIVSHGAVFMAMLRLLGMPFDRIQNCQAVYMEPSNNEGGWKSTLVG